MILYRLKCDGGHEFEAWFRDAATFDRQAEAGAVACPMCESRRVGKAIMAPRLARHHGARTADAPAVPAGAVDASPPPAGSAPGSKPEAGREPGDAMTGERLGESGAHQTPAAPLSAAPDTPLAEALRTLRDVVERTCEDVGDRFAEEARRIHYGESDARGIRGQASAEEADALRDEGISFSTLPWIRRPDA